jgi:Flp pilus assembly protein CpaB
MSRRSPRALALWAAAVVVALLTATVVGRDLAALHRRAAALGPEVPAVVAARDLPVGTTLRRADLHSRAVHRSQLPRAALTRPDALLGRVVAVSVLRGGFLQARHVASRRRAGLDGVVPEGMRVMRVVVSDSITPRGGAAVDVLATFDPAAAGATSADDGTTSTVAAGVTVLGTDARATGGTGRTGAAGVTLLVDPEQATALADAQVNGVLTLALVPPEDATHP